MGTKFDLFRIILLLLHLKVRTVSFAVQFDAKCAGDPGMNTTAGSYSLVGSVPPEDAGVVKRLRAGGAIILGVPTPP